MVIKAKDTPWDAVLMGSAVCTVAAKIKQFAISIPETSGQSLFSSVPYLGEHTDLKSC